MFEDFSYGVAFGGDFSRLGDNCVKESREHPSHPVI